MYSNNNHFKKGENLFVPITMSCNLGRNNKKVLRFPLNKRIHFFLKYPFFFNSVKLRHYASEIHCSPRLQYLFVTKTTQIPKLTMNNVLFHCESHVETLVAISGKQINFIIK